MKKQLMGILMLAMLLSARRAEAFDFGILSGLKAGLPSVCVAAPGALPAGVASAWHVHEPFFNLLVYDLSGIVSRAVQAGVKYFLTDDEELIAELVYDGASGSAPGGQGGAYTGTKGTAELNLKAVTSTIADIPAEAGAYPSNVKISDKGIDELAEYRIQTIVQERASLDQLSQEKWEIQYRAQQRAIQAMTDALVLKKAYKDLADVVENLPEGKYQDYNAAASSVATRRLLLDSLMALRKRVIAARVRARAETMEATIESVATAPVVDASGPTGLSGVSSQTSGSGS